MQPQLEICQNCDKPIKGTVFSVLGDNFCVDCYKMYRGRPANFVSDLAGDPYHRTVPKSDMVNRPPHYNTAGIECIDAMRAMSEGALVEPHAAYCWQNAFKYLWRWPYKEKPVEDLKKARWYLDRLIKEVEK